MSEANTNWTLQNLPYEADLETKRILKKLPSVHRALAELKGMAQTIPNQIILLNTLLLQEAKDSSAIENIITTHDDLFKAELQFENIKSLEAKEVQSYSEALKTGFGLVSENGLLRCNDIVKIQEVLEKNKAGFRKVPGTVLSNSETGETIYTPPQDSAEIEGLMSNLEQFINDDEILDVDPLIKMAVIHFQFESIHPFYDGNGRTGRIINILYLVQKQLLNLPILYLSRYIINHKPEYYKLLQQVRDQGEWEEWVLYMLEAIETTSKEVLSLIIDIKALMQEYKNILRNRYKFYSQDLLNNLFKHPYTKIEFVVEDLGVSRITASNYLNKLAKDGLLVEQKIGTGKYYVNNRLVDLFLK